MDAARRGTAGGPLDVRDACYLIAEIPERLQAQQALCVAVRESAQERHKADQGRRPPVRQTAKRITLRGSLGMKLDEHGEAFGDREKHG